MYGEALYENPGATVDDLREAIKVLEDVERTARRVLGRSHPLTVDIEDDLQNARANRSLRRGCVISMNAIDAPEINKRRNLRATTRLRP